MDQNLSDTLTQTIADALETMAFVAVMPAEDVSQPPAEALLVRVRYTMPRPGSLELVAPRSLGAYLASNLLGTDPSDPAADAIAEDTLKELMNVTCGSLLTKLSDEAAEPFQMNVPEIESFDPAAWKRFTTGENHSVLDADGHLMAVSLNRAA